MFLSSVKLLMAFSSKVSSTISSSDILYILSSLSIEMSNLSSFLLKLILYELKLFLFKPIRITGRTVNSIIPGFLNSKKSVLVTCPKLAFRDLREFDISS